MAREYTKKLLEMVEEGLIDKDTLIISCLNYMSEDEVRDMMDVDDLLPEEEDDDDFDEDED